MGELKGWRERKDSWLSAPSEQHFQQPAPCFLLWSPEGLIAGPAGFCWEGAGGPAPFQLGCLGLDHTAGKSPHAALVQVTERQKYTNRRVFR